MIKLCFTLLICCSAFLVSAQDIQPYYITIKTTECRQKGVLQRVESDCLFIYSKDGLHSIPLKNIEFVEVRAAKTRYQMKNYLSSGKSQKYSIDRSGKKVDQYGNTVPALVEEGAATPTFSPLLFGITNAVAFSLYSINPKVATFKLDRVNDQSDLIALNNFSIQHQSNPTQNAELNKMNSTALSAQ